MNLEEIKNRVDDAMPGPWVVQKRDSPNMSWVFSENDVFVVKEHIASVEIYSDAEFIAHARQDIPALIAEVENLKERLKIEEELFENSNEALGHAQEENVRLREALAFYADPKTHEQICSEEPPRVWNDEGKIARQALEGTE